MGKNQLRLLKFAMRFPGWHGYGKDRNTVAALRALEYYGLIEVSKETRQFRLANRKEFGEISIEGNLAMRSNST